MNFQLLSRSNRSLYRIGLSTIVLIPLLAGFTSRSAVGRQTAKPVAAEPVAAEPVRDISALSASLIGKSGINQSSINQSAIHKSAISNLQATPPQVTSLDASYNKLPTAQQIALTSQEQSTLRQGQVLFSGNQGNYTVRVMANGSTDDAWAVLTDYNNFSRFLPGVESSHLLTSNGSQKQFEQVNVVRIFPFTHRERVVIATSESYPDKIAFSLVDGDLEKLQGVWYVTGAGNQVMVTHQVSVQPGGSNRSLFYTIYEDNLRKTMAALRQEIERRSQQ